jgi:hypothetical protein
MIMPVCSVGTSWQDCAPRIVAALKASTTPEDALRIAVEWSQRYQELYNEKGRVDWSRDENDKFEDTIKDKLQDDVLAATGFDQIIKSLMLEYFPSLSAALAYLGRFNVYVQAFSLVINPAPISDDFVVASDVNQDINGLLREKISIIMPFDFDGRYQQALEQGYLLSKGVSIHAP